MGDFLIPLLVEYLVGRYAKAAGKDIRQIGKDTLEALRAYQWPGDIRELQNVVERAVILSEGETFVVDQDWLKGRIDRFSTPAPIALGVHRS
jgi:formate hydrogenlyase transcriptional activator